nr:MAG TPA: hypothetical protein [Crassvirales sp.]
MIKINIVIPSKYAEESNTSVIFSILNISAYWICNLCTYTHSYITENAAFRVSLLHMSLGKDLIQYNTEHITYNYDRNAILKSITISYLDNISWKDRFEVFIDFNPKIGNILRTIEIT